MKKILGAVIVILVIFGLAVYLPPYINNWPEARARNNNSDDTAANIPQEESPKEAQTSETRNQENKSTNSGQTSNTTKPSETPKDSTSLTSLLILVNKVYSLPKDYKPSDLVIPEVRMKKGIQDEKRYMRKEAAQALENLFAAGDSEGIELYHISAFRSYSAQKILYDYRMKNQGSAHATQYTAPPGHSEHQTGLSVDVINKAGSDGTLEEAFANSKEGKWLAANAHKYGFIIRYPKGKEKITGYNYEPWHIRFVGKEAAAEIYSRNITLEEYLNK